MVRLTATEVARSFSRVMNRVGAGEEIEIVRNGTAIAELRRARARTTITAEQWRELMADAPPLDDDFARAISVVTASELLHGVHRAVDATVRMRRLAYVERVLGRLEPLPIGMHVARAHAEIWTRLEASGSLIGSHDLWIAATALAHGMRVATLNVRHFERVPGLEVLSVS